MVHISLAVGHLADQDWNECAQAWHAARGGYRVRYKRLSRDFVSSVPEPQGTIRRYARISRQ